MNKLKAVSILRATKGDAPMWRIAKHCNVSRDTLYKTLTRDTTKLNNPTLAGICTYFDISLGEFIIIATEAASETNTKS